MNDDKCEFALNRSEQRKQRFNQSRFSLFAPVQFAVLALVSMCGIVRAQCYTDPITGQQVCPRSGANSSAANGTAHCRIRIGDGTLGSGTLVGRDPSVGLVLTCAHLFDNSTSRIVVSFAGGGQFAARVSEVDRANDLAALVIRRPGVEPLTIGDGEPAGTLTACGFGPNGVFRCVQGGITGRAMATGAKFPSTVICGAVRPGDSGGGVLNTRGQLVGVVWGQRDGQTYAICGRPVFEYLNRVRAKLFASQERGGQAHFAPRPSQRWCPPQNEPVPNRSGPQVDWQAWTNELDARIRALDAKKQDKGDYLQHGDLNGYQRMEDATRRFESVHSVVESVRQHVDQIVVDRAGILRGVSLGKFAAGALGLSGPLAAAVVIAGGLAGRQIKSRLRRLESHLAINSRPSTLDRPIAIDSPPPPQRSVPETHYVPVEKDSFAKAHQWASEHVARKYPGATEVLQTQDSLIKQYMAAK
jgi:hypothetical protein